MTRGTKSLLFGVHQFLWHPWTVARAWKNLYGKWPTFYESVAIFFHDWGYRGCKEMDGPDGKLHPERGSHHTYRAIQFFEAWRGNRSDSPGTQRLASYYYRLVLFHSRSMAKMYGHSPSAMSDPDKQSILFDPFWFYYIRATLSGEINEYRENAIKSGKLLPCSNWQWLRWYRIRIASGVRTQT